MKEKLACIALAASLSNNALAQEAPGECYEIGVDFAIFKTFEFCEASIGSEEPEDIPKECIDAALSGCRNTIINAIEEFGNDCAVDISEWSYLQKELFKIRTCNEITE